MWQLTEGYWTLKNGDVTLAEVWRPHTHQAWFVAVIGLPIFYEPNKDRAIERAEAELQKIQRAIATTLCDKR